MYARDNSTIEDRREMLRVKVKSLAAEAKIIRKEAQRTHGRLKWELNHHRQTVVREEARASCLALGFIRGRTLAQMEMPGSKQVPWAKVERLCAKYGPRGWNGPTDEQRKTT